ncbi:MAG: sigma-70 family RNA polymerase sigma factor [Myxococcales bacterium]|nr:sigma-70 family RNA polymerase sigma factor [Myxococcales bacterium]
MTAAPAEDLQPTPHPPGLDARFAQVFEQHFDSVWTNLRRLGVPAADLDDATQETFLVAFRRWDDFRAGASWRAWLFGISRRVAARHRRGSGRRLRLVADAEHQPSTPADPHDEIARRHAATLVERFIERLPPRKREVFILAEIEGLSGAEIAHALSIKPNTVWSRLYGARAAFDRHLEMLRAREDGASERLDRATVLGRHRSPRAPERSRRRVLSALGVQLGSVPPAPWWLALKPVAIAVGLGAAGILTVAGVVRVSRPSAELVDPRPPSSIVDVAEATSSRPSAVTPSAATPVGAGPSGAGPSGAGSSAAASVSASPTAPLDALAPTSTARADARARAVPSPSAGSEPGVAADRLSEEAALLHAMRRANRAGDHRETLRLAEVHARSFGDADGVLALDRQALQIVALCQLGRRDQARAEAIAWSTQHPTPPLPAEVREGCTTPPKRSTNVGGAGQEP